jgi:hypothetical protein
MTNLQKHFIDYIEDPEYGLNRDLTVGDKIQDTDDAIWTVTSIDNGIAYYDKKMHEIYGNTSSKLVDCCFIYKFSDGIYNEVMRHST